MKTFYEDTKKIKIIAIFLLILVLFVLFSGLVAIFIFKILKLGTVDLDNIHVVLNFFGVFVIMVFSIYLFSKTDFSYFIEVKEGMIKIGIKGLEYLYKINEIEECYIKKVKFRKRVIIKIMDSVIEITTRKPKKLLKVIESWKVETIN